MSKPRILFIFYYFRRISFSTLGFLFFKENRSHWFADPADAGNFDSTFLHSFSRNWF